MTIRPDSLSMLSSRRRIRSQWPRYFAAKTGSSPSSVHDWLPRSWKAALRMRARMGGGDLAGGDPSLWCLWLLTSGNVDHAGMSIPRPGQRRHRRGQAMAEHSRLPLAPVTGSLGSHILAIGVQIPDQTAGRGLRKMSRSEGDAQQAAYGDITNGESATW